MTFEFMFQSLLSIASANNTPNFNLDEAPRKHMLSSSQIKKLKVNKRGLTQISPLAVSDVSSEDGSSGEMCYR